MFRRRFESFFGTILLAAVIPLVLFSAIRSRIGSARARRKKQRPDSLRKPSPCATQAAGELPINRSAETYEHMIDSAIAEEHL